MSTKKTLAFIGLGVMGGPMAGHLARAGYRVTAFNRSAQRAAKWRGLWEAEDCAFCQGGKYRFYRQYDGKHTCAKCPAGYYCSSSINHAEGSCELTTFENKY